MWADRRIGQGGYTTITGRGSPSRRRSVKWPIRTSTKRAIHGLGLDVSEIVWRYPSNVSRRSDGYRPRGHGDADQSPSGRVSLTRSNGSEMGVRALRAEASIARSRSDGT